MGSTISRVFSSKDDVMILMLGLYDVGKTTILYKLKLGEVTTTIPTIGMVIDRVDYKHVSILAMDVGGRCPMRPLMRHYYKTTNGIVYTFDSSDRATLDFAKFELERVLEESELQGVPVLFLANKQDVPNALSVQDIHAAVYDIPGLKDRPWVIYGTSAIDDTSKCELYEGLEWLTKQIASKNKHDTYEAGVVVKDNVESSQKGKSIGDKSLSFSKLVHSLKAYIGRQ